MKRAMLGALAFALTLGLANPASAHHPPKFERCLSVEFSGKIHEIQWKRPHVLLSVETSEGMIYELSWLDITLLDLAGIDESTLHVGDEVDVAAGFRPNEIVDRPMLLSYIHRESDGWGWAQTPQGC
jgi:hypothetical protein